MTTNTNKLAEAIGIISSVLADEIALTQHFVEVDDDETVSSDEYDGLKELITDAFPDFITEIDSMKEDIGLVADVEDEAADGYNWATDTLDGDEDNDNDDDQDNDDETEPTDEKKMDVLISASAELQETNEQLTETLRTLHAGLADLEENLTNLQDEVFGL